MIHVLSVPAEEAYDALSMKLQAQFDKQLGLLLKDLRHPSLHAKKYDAANDIWQARINRDYRFYFLIHDDAYYILSITKHPK